MFGRYSLDKEGLIYAGGNFEEKFKFIDKECYIKIDKLWQKSSINITADNRLPICESESFDEHIVARFVDFIRVAFGIENLGNNLDYIATTLDEKSKESPRQILKRYFLKEFFIDHLQIYQKKPIYQFINPEVGSKFLIYIHRNFN